MVDDDSMDDEDDNYFLANVLSVKQKRDVLTAKMAVNPFSTR
jgi:hypothetical protein